MGDTAYTIRLDDLELNIGLGIHAEELAAPQRVIVSVAITCVYPEAPEDRIDQVMDYDQVRAGIHAIVAGGHIMLQEVLCDRIAALCMTDPRVIEVRVRSVKLDIYPDAKIGCEVVRKREGAR